MTGILVCDEWICLRMEMKWVDDQILANTEKDRTKNFMVRIT